jgi:gas vesicle protein
VGATVAAVVGLLLNQQSAKRDRRAAARELEEERERAAREADRRYLQTTLNQVTESFASYQTYGAEDERGHIALRKLRVYLNALPDDMATLVRHELGIARTTTSEQTLLSFAESRG